MATALDLFYPYDAGAGSAALEGAWSDMFSTLPGSGIIAGLDNEFAVTAGTGRQVLVGTGRAWISGQFGRSTGSKALAIAANVSGQPRIDRVVIRNNFAGNQIELDVLTGTPGASPSPPALTHNGSISEYPLADVGPLASGFANVLSGDVHDQRLMLSAYGLASAVPGSDSSLWLFSGIPIGTEILLRDGDGSSRFVYDGSAYLHEQPTIICTSSTRPSTPFAGMKIFETDTAQELTYQGGFYGWTPPFLSSWGVVGTPVNITANQGPFFAPTDIPGASITFTAVPNRRYRHRVSGMISNNTAGDGADIMICDASSTVLRPCRTHVHAGGDFESFEMTWNESGLSAGSVTRKLQCRVISTGAAAVQAATESLQYDISDYGPS